MSDEALGMFLIRKGGAYYRPNAQGYTRDREEAGRFTLAEAETYSHPNGPNGPRDGITYELALPMHANKPETAGSERRWKPGDRVQRAAPRSYLFPGVVIAAGYKLDGKTWHCEVECIAPGVEGMTHVFPARMLEPLADNWQAQDWNAAAATLIDGLPGDSFVLTRSEGLWTMRTLDAWQHLNPPAAREDVEEVRAGGERLAFAIRALNIGPDSRGEMGNLLDALKAWEAATTRPAREQAPETGDRGCVAWSWAQGKRAPACRRGMDCGASVPDECPAAPDHANCAVGGAETNWTRAPRAFGVAST